MKNKIDDATFEKMLNEFAQRNKEMIEGDIGRLLTIEIKAHTVVFRGEKESRVFHKETLKADLECLAKKSMSIESLGLFDPIH